MAISNRATTGIPATKALAHILSNPEHAATIIRELKDLGFIIIPEPYRKPARRGKVINDDPWIGKSHAARLCGG